MHLSYTSLLFALCSLVFSSPIEDFTQSPLDPPISTPSLSNSCTFASHPHITHLFSALATGDTTTFFACVLDNVSWTVQGTHPLAGIYTNKTIFLVNTFARIAKLENMAAPHSIEILNIVGGCDEEWSAQEIRSQVYMNNGVFFDNTYAWMTRWNAEGQIVQVRAYLDSALVAKVVTENETPTNSTFTSQRDTFEPGPGGMPDMGSRMGSE